MSATAKGVKITLTNEDKSYVFSEWVEQIEDERTMGELFRAYRSEYGRCTSKVRQDPDGRVVGWYFEKRTNYEGEDETYLQGAWVVVGDYVPATPETVVS